MEIQKIFSSYDEERIYSVLMSEEEMYLFSELEEEIQRNKEIEKILKNLPKEDQEHAGRMWVDADRAGRARMDVMNKTGAVVGAGLGYAAAKIGKKIAKSRGKTIKHGKLISLGSALAGAGTGVAVVRKKSSRRGQDIWNEGDERILEYVKSNPRLRKKLREEYEPISPLWTKEDKD